MKLKYNQYQDCFIGSNPDITLTQEEMQSKKKGDILSNKISTAQSSKNIKQIYPKLMERVKEGI